jgi:hypothetical protein
MARVSTVDDIQNEHLEANPLTQDKTIQITVWDLIVQRNERTKGFSTNGQPTLKGRQDYTI